MCAAVVERMDAYDNYGACQYITAFVDALSNWYVRRSRDRFWAADKRGIEKLDAYWTLYEAIVTTTKLIAPFVPFLAEALWQNLARGTSSEAQDVSHSDSSLAPCASPLAPESVHLCDYPTGDAAAVDEALSARMNLVREIASLGRNARNAASLKVRQPLAKVEVVLADTTHQKWLEEHVRLIAEELNVKEVAFTTHGEEYISYSVVPNFKRLGPRLGKNMPAAKKALAEVDAAKLLDDLKSAGKATLNLPNGEAIELDNEDIEVRLAAKEGWAAAQGKGCVVVLATELTPELVAEGLARDVIRLIQDRRKEIGCEYTNRIEVGLTTDSTELSAAIEAYRDYIAQETLAVKLGLEPVPGIDPARGRSGRGIGGLRASREMSCPSRTFGPLKIAALISGTGRTLKNFIDLMEEGDLPVEMLLVISSTPTAGGLKLAEAAGIPTRVIEREKLAKGPAGDQAFGDAVFAACREAGVACVVMAGFLKLAPVPDDFVGRVVNIHPALIPAFCGPGMYGERVHQAVLDAGVKVTGCTVHFVDNQYDHGPIIWQQPVPVFDDDTADTLAQRVFEVEKEAYPHVLRMLAAGRVKLEGSRVTILKGQRGERSRTRAYPID